MNKVVKVSIGNIAFTLEEEAFATLNQYLDSLNSHYSNHSNGAEIVEGIEERIAELFLEKGNGNRIITSAMVNEVIQILGEPQTIDRESGYSSTTSQKNKKFFRDPSNKILGGVCSGLGNYFDKEPSLFRLIFVLASIFISIPSCGIGFGAFVILYLCLWLCFPAAKTVEDRCRMKGETNSINSIEKNIENGAKEIENCVRKSRIGYFLGKCFGFIFTIIGIIGIITTIVAIFGINISTHLPISILNSVSVMMGWTFATSLLLKILLPMMIVIPFVMFLYAGIQLLFGFKSPRWKPGLVLFLLWIASIIGFTIVGVNSTKSFWNVDKRNDSHPIALESDTLYIHFDGIEEMKDNKVFIDADYNEYDLLYLDNSDKRSPIIVQYPFIDIRKREDTQPRVVTKSNYFQDRMTFDEIKSMKEAKETNFYSFEGNTLTLYPIRYSKSHTLSEIGREIAIYVKDGTTVIVEEPIYHTFTNTFEYNNISSLF